MLVRVFGHDGRSLSPIDINSARSLMFDQKARLLSTTPLGIQLSESLVIEQTGPTPEPSDALTNFSQAVELPAPMLGYEAQLFELSEQLNKRISELGDAINGLNANQEVLASNFRATQSPTTQKPHSFPAQSPIKLEPVTRDQVKLVPIGTATLTDNGVSATSRLSGGFYAEEMIGHPGDYLEWVPKEQSITGLSADIFIDSKGAEYWYKTPDFAWYAVGSYARPYARGQRLSNQKTKYQGAMRLYVDDGYKLLWQVSSGGDDWQTVITSKYSINALFRPYGFLRAADSEITHVKIKGWAETPD